MISKIERIKLYRFVHECSLQEATRAIERENLILDIQQLSIVNNLGDVRELLLRVLEFCDK